ncbi:MAG: hypothetical protein JSW47_19605 [Phycisphaerales bacterium]|nr:MAG: hypothetical protein JSW47_19605 [Phycisphaerales bacterium]UCF17490.1 MAG: hypothetical protein JSW59_08505 [Phycisphaerales bacterium]
MADTNRKIQELLSDYAGALRDGCVPAFLKSLTRQEGKLIASSEEFWDATEVVRIMNDVGFADKAVTADVGLFISRVDANIVSRSKKAKTPTRGKRSNGARAAQRNQKSKFKMQN